MAGSIRPGLKFKALVDLKIGCIPVRSCIDTGSTDCAIDGDILDSAPRLKDQICRKTPKTCVAVDGKLIKSPFSLKLPVCIAGKCYYQEFECISGLIHPVILGTNS